MRLHSAVAFLGSWLLFQLELISARLLLPYFGGSAYVWTTSVMAFAGLLLAGTLYARGMLRKFRAAVYSRAHLALLAAPLLSLPIAVRAPLSFDHPIVALLLGLGRACALPFFVLSTTMPVIQSWADEDEGGSYRLYAASNAGALAALLSYPLLVEPFVSLNGQMRYWTWTYALYAGLHFLCLPRAREGVSENTTPPALSFRQVLSWIALSAGPCAAMLACANFISFHFAAVPLFWAAPLAIYLSTYILNFKRDPLTVSLPAMAGALLLGLFLVPSILGGAGAGTTAVLSGLFFNLAILFAAGMACHRELALSKPLLGAAPSFYAAVAAGGWLGSILIGVAVPCLGRYGANLAIDWSIAFLLCAAGWFGKNPLAKGRARALAVGIAIGGAAAFSWGLRGSQSSTLMAWRNFYGVYRVDQSSRLRRFIHGNTVHGLQYRDSGLQAVPLGYFHEKSPIGRVLRSYGGRFKTIGVVGLGAGTLAAFGRPGQELDFYELDPKVADIARGYFGYLGASRAKIKIMTGDARLALQDSARTYDLLVLDAFSSDSIPVHLITREAFEVYLKRLKPGGLILCNISNRLLDLTPVLAGVIRSLGLSGAASSYERGASASEGPEFFDSRWAALSPDSAWLQRLSAEGWESLERAPAVPAWTDQHASVLSALRLWGKN